MVRSIFYGSEDQRDYPCWEITDVPGRSLVTAHVANEISELLGCIAPGLGLGYVHNRWAVTSSRRALSYWLEVMPDPHELEIVQGHLPSRVPETFVALNPS